MKYLKIKYSHSLLFFLLINSLISPFLAFGFIHDNSSTIQDFGINSDREPTSQSQQIPLYRSSSIFDEILLKELSGLNDQEIDIIFLFDTEVSQAERIKLIEDVLEDFVIINNYNIIPGVFLTCNKAELIENEENLRQISVLKRIYKSNTYTLPYFSEDLPKTSELNENSYPNWWVSAIGAENLPYDGTGVRVAVIDTGIYEHPDLNVVMSENFVTGELLPVPDDIGHGTHVAGIIGGDGGGSSGKYRGVAPGVSLLAARAGDTSGLSEGDVISAIDWSVNTAGADILSMSFGDDNPLLNDPIILALSNAADQGVISVSSAGNSGPGYLSGGSPSSGLDVISVGATDSNNNLAFFSSRGPSYSYLNYPDIVAPGVNIISTESPESIISDEKRFIGDFFDFSDDADYIPLSGTSMACPVVSGALAILKQAFPLITPETARIALLKGAQKLTDKEDHKKLNSGLGLINVSASLDYLVNLNNTLSNINDVALVAPNELPVEPFDLLNFPGDKQLFNLTIISGKNNTFDINIPLVNGITISVSNSQIIFDNPDTSIIPILIQINSVANPGLRSFKINISSGSTNYDSVNISIQIQIPQHRILLDSYHGLNDWYPELSFYQMNFYDWIKDLSEIDISVDYLAEYWTPHYNKNLNNSILTEEKLTQYDLVVLQNPILPYSPLEITNLINYFESGGNILFLGTRYEDMCIENINDLFSSLELDLQINEENLVDEEWLGIGAVTNTQPITDFNHTQIFNNTSSFSWNYGSTFSTANAIASKNGQTLAATYDGHSFNKGRVVAFGDLHWLSNLYKNSGDHQKISENLMDYFFEPEEISIVVKLNSLSSSNSNINITIYATDLNTDTLIESSTLNSYINVSIYNTGFSDSIIMKSTANAIAFNYSYSLPFTSAIPYSIRGNLTIDSISYNFDTKFLYFDAAEIPNINYISVNGLVERDVVDSLDIDVGLDDTNYQVNTFLAIYPFTYYSRRGTVNKTLALTNTLPNLFEYSVSYTPISSDPSGLTPFFVLPFNPVSSYYNPNSPRMISLFNNNPPEFIEDTSVIIIDGNQLITLEETHTEDSLLVITTSQGSSFDLSLNLTDSVGYEDQDSSEMRASVNFYMVSISEDNTIIPIDPRNYPHSTMTYNSLSDTHDGLFNIPFDSEYSSITGTKRLSSASDFSTITQDGYLGLILITIFDSEGDSEDFLIVLLVQPTVQFDFILLLIIVGVVIAVALVIGIFYTKKKKNRGIKEFYPTEYMTEENIQTKDDLKIYYCPFCGDRLTGLRSFCPSCGKSLNFDN